MDLSSSPMLLEPSDPALLDDLIHFDQTQALLPSSNYSDELEAIRLTNEESKARKNKEGQVIQHRAWKLADVFRSDDDRSLGDTPTRKRPSKTLTIPPFSSSPPIFTMASLISSPVAYPLSSSPPVNKRPAPQTALRKPRTIGGFLEDNSDEENLPDGSERPSKRRQLSGKKSPSALAPRPFDGSEKPLPNVQLKNPPRPRNIGGFLVDDDEEDLDGLDFQIPSALAKSPKDSDSSIPLPDPKRNASSGSSFLFSHFADRREVKTCAGKTINIRPRAKNKLATFEELVAARSITKAGKAKKSYYGIDIHQLIDDAARENRQEESRKSKVSEEPLPSVEQPPSKKNRKSIMWTEKYRARRFFDLVGDDRTHREVLRWLKGWDPIVFPKSGKPKSTYTKRPNAEGILEEKPHRKILLLTGAPGLGKTTLAHVCAMQAGYEIMEINASDERSSNVVKGRIRTTVGTESVKTVGTTTKDGRPQKLARPVCVVVDEVDGVVSGSGGSGEGGFIKALIDLIQLDAKNDSGINGTPHAQRRKKNGDNFRLLRPLILVCNDVYHPSLRPLRQSSFAEVIHMRKPPLEAVVTRMKTVFAREGVPCDGEGVRKLCEATWGMSSGPETPLDASGTGEGDLRSLLVVGEWVAGKLKSCLESKSKLTRKWVEQNMLSNLSHGGGGARGVGRGGAKEIVSRVFLTGAGFPKSEVQPQFNEATCSDPTIPRAKVHAAEIAKKAGMDRLREMVDTGGDIDRIVTDIFSVYPSQPFNDDSILSKPDSAYEWLHFHDACSSRVYSDQDWELMPYLSQPILACHDLFASPAKHYSLPPEQKKWNNNDDTDGLADKEIPFSGPRADYEAKEAEKSHRATIQELQSSMAATLLRSFRSPEEIATDLLPHLARMLAPDVKPIIVGGSGDQRGIASVRKASERDLIHRAVHVMCSFSIRFERGKLEGDFSSRPSYVYRMEPPLDVLTDFPTAAVPSLGAPAPVRYAVRQVLDQEMQKTMVLRANEARQARYTAGAHPDLDSSPNHNLERDNHSHGHGHGQTCISTAPIPAIKKDFFGRVIKDDYSIPTSAGTGTADVRSDGMRTSAGKGDPKVWVTFHEGFSNAVRKPVTVEEILREL